MDRRIHTRYQPRQTPHLRVRDEPRGHLAHRLALYVHDAAPAPAPHASALKIARYDCSCRHPSIATHDLLVRPEVVLSVGGELANRRNRTAL